MDSKVIKVMRHLRIKKILRKTVSPSGTVRPLPASKNILRGLEAENHVRNHYLEKGFKLLHHRLRTKLAEADLVFLDQDGRILIVEVKSWTRPEFIEFRLSQKQKRRLQRLIISISESHGEVYAHLAIVSQSNQITIFEDVFG